MSVIGRFMRYILFCVFFASGMGALVFSILVDEINDVYQNSDALLKSEAENERLKSLSGEYDLQLKQLAKDPNVVGRLKRITFGENPESEDTAYPTASSQDLETAEYVLATPAQSIDYDDPIRTVVERCMHEKIRQSLFFSGAGLILITFIFFGASRQRINGK